MYAIQLLGKSDNWYVPADSITGRLAFFEDFDRANCERGCYSGPSRVVEVKAVAIEPIVWAAGTINVFDIQGQPGKYRELWPNESKTMDTVSVQEPGKDVRFFKRVI
jgi:hypothetical protein